MTLSDTEWPSKIFYGTKRRAVSLRQLSFLFTMFMIFKYLNELLAYQCFCHAVLCISAVYAVVRCLFVRLSVHPSVTVVDSVRTNKHIFIRTILVFPHQTSWQYSYEDLLNGGVECRWARQKLRFSTNIWPSVDVCCSANNNCDGPPCSLSHRPSGISESCVSQTAAWTTTTKRREESRTEFF